MAKIKFAIPTPDTPGYLRRALMALEFRDNLQGAKATPRFMRQMVDFLVTFVEEPADKVEARDAVLDASELEFYSMLTALTATLGGGEPTTVPLGKLSTSSSSTSMDEAVLQLGS